MMIVVVDQLVTLVYLGRVDSTVGSFSYSE